MNYKHLKRITGSRGYVYVLDEKTCIKVMHSFSEPRSATIEAKMQEQMRLILLDHPELNASVPRVYESTDNTITMEYIRGKHIMSETMESDEERMRLVKRLHTIMELGFENGIYLRDLFYGNIIFTENDHIVLIDFGNTDIVEEKDMLLNMMYTNWDQEYTKGDG